METLDNLVDAFGMIFVATFLISACLAVVAGFSMWLNKDWRK